MAKVKIGLRGLNTVQKLQKARHIVQAAEAQDGEVRNNLPVNELDKAVEMLEKAAEMAEFGDKRAIAARQLCERNLEEAIRQMANAVEQVTRGDRKAIESMGYEVRSTNNRARPIDKPAELAARRLDTEGAIALKWKPVANSKSYLVQTCAKGPNNDWQTSGFSTRSRCTIDALEPGKTYRFRVLAIGAKGIGPPSATIEIMAA